MRSLFSRSGRSSRLLLAGVAVGLGLIFMYRGTVQDSASVRLATAINEQTAKLNLQPRTIELISEKAFRVREAIKHGDFTAAHRITADVLASSHLQNWRYYPFTDFIAEIADLGDPAFEARLSEWVAQTPTDAIPVLTRAQYYFDLGWLKRGHSFASQTQASHMTAFASDMEKALADVDAAIRLSDGNPYSFYLRLRVLHGFGASEELKRAFEEAIAKYPRYYPLYDIVLGTIEPRWGGSIAAMYAFVDRYAGDAPDYSPIKLLYLSLYRDLLGSALADCADDKRDKDKMAQCVKSGMEKTIKPELGRQVLIALGLYDHLDKHEFDVAMRDILFDMLGTSGGDAYSGAVLQLAASSMHSDTQLNPEKPSRNDYIIDEAVSESWYAKGFYDNAVKKAQDALIDAKAAAFPNEEEKDLAIAGIYQDIAKAYSKLHQYIDVIVYEKAALALGHKTEAELFICYGYYQLKDYHNALLTCTQAIIDQTGNLPAYYWRGVTHRKLGDADAALQDLTVVADSEHHLRTSAAIEMSVIYGDKKDIESELGVLSKYTYLYDPNTQSKEDMAVSYNNRCYAYMELGDLKKALADCTASLEYGSLPDAYRKQQELIRRINAHESNL